MSVRVAAVLKELESYNVVVSAGQMCDVGKCGINNDSYFPSQEGQSVKTHMMFSVAKSLPNIIQQSCSKS